MSEEQPSVVDTLYLDAEHFALIAESQPPLEHRERVVPFGPPRRSFPLGDVDDAGPVRPDEEPTP